MKNICKNGITLALAFAIAVFSTFMSSVSADATKPADAPSNETKEQIVTDGIVEPDVLPIILTAAGVLWSSSKYYEAVKETYVETMVKNHYKLPEKCWYGVCQDQDIKTFKLDGYNKYIFLEFGDADDFGMVHILARHHPKYYTGIFTYGAKHSFFNPETSFSDIEGMISTLANYATNEKDLATLGFNGRHSVTGYWNKKMYKMVVEYGTVTTLYPYGWNEATYK